MAQAAMRDLKMANAAQPARKTKANNAMRRAFVWLPGTAPAVPPKRIRLKVGACILTSPDEICLQASFRSL
jgi:hypothetical protein